MNLSNAASICRAGCCLSGGIVAVCLALSCPAHQSGAPVLGSGHQEMLMLSPTAIFSSWGVRQPGLVILLGAGKNGAGSPPHAQGDGLERFYLY